MVYLKATHATKAGVRYRYYVSEPSLHGEARTATLGSVSRVPAAEIEQTIVSALQKRLRQEPIRDQKELAQLNHQKLTSLISRVDVQKTQLVVTLRSVSESTAPDVLSIAWQKPPFKRFREILLPHGIAREKIRHDRAERRVRLVNAIARGRAWLDEIVTGSVIDAEQLAKRERCTVRQVNLTLSLAFLAPQLVRAAVEGRLPRGVNIERLRDPDVLWSRQFQDLRLESGPVLPLARASANPLTL